MKLLIKLLLLHLHWTILEFSNPADDQSSTDCQIHNVAGFLQYVCTKPIMATGLTNISLTYLEATTFKCVNTDQFYHVLTMASFGRQNLIVVDVRCEQDGNFYQACALRASPLADQYSGFDLAENQRRFPCGYLCEKDYEIGRLIVGIPNFKLRSSVSGFFSNWHSTKNNLVCDGKHDCFNTDLDEWQCGDTSEMCDLICDTYPTCEDESFCNGYIYGMWCDNGTTYVPPQNVCDGPNALLCEDGSDESLCQVDNKLEHLHTCTHSGSGDTIPVFNITRCRPLLEYNFFSNLYVMTYCTDYLDQTNCSDHSRVGLYCEVHGEMSSVAHQIICIDENSLSTTKIIPAICDDGLDKACIDASVSCSVHKHLLCDGEVDCYDHSDETGLHCQHMTDVLCERRYVFGKSNRSIAFPISWIHDGITDCWNGEDEKHWETCGFERTRRFKTEISGICTEVFLCSESDLFIPFTHLCDKVNTCGNENQICKQSRDQRILYQNAPRESLNYRVRLAHCLAGLKNLEILADSCVKENFTFSKTTILGKNGSLEVSFPNSKRDCRYFYGETYVLLSCLGRCENAHCPIQTGMYMKFDSCPGQFKQTKVFSTDNYGNLTILIKNAKTGLLGNDIFTCRDRPTCLTYDKVCNLVDDCGDESDEASCSNNYQCETSREYIPISQKCDQVLQCADKSDECNDFCGGTLINGGMALRVMAWIIGISSIVLNISGLFKMSKLITFKSEGAFLTNCMVVLISFGDILTGIYLTVLASFDLIYGATFCKMHLDWLVSPECNVLGIINSLGSQISLFSMTMFSIIRAQGTLKTDLRAPEEATNRSILKVAFITVFILLFCTAISSFPLLVAFEDYFVNGIKYDNANPLFLGSPDKEQHLSVLEKYYGRMRLAGHVLSWKQIRELTRAMFSNDYGGIEMTTISFYGNDPVCVFKFFVDADDPQRNFTLVIVSVNCLCFVVIMGCYAAISVASRNSMRSLTLKNNNNSVEKQDLKLQRMVLSLIISDFLCWVPFIFICWLHLFGVVDGKPWYRVFAILVLPINSVVNPILYNKSMTQALEAAVSWSRAKISHCFNRLTTVLHTFQRENATENASDFVAAEAENVELRRMEKLK